MLSGLVLKTRGNPGGLLVQAIQVSDDFVEEWTIVTTVGVNGTLREPKLARADGGEREFPMAVLISSESASASEIVAGAPQKPDPPGVVGGEGIGEGVGAGVLDVHGPGAGGGRGPHQTNPAGPAPGGRPLPDTG